MDKKQFLQQRLMLSISSISLLVEYANTVNKYLDNDVLQKPLHEMFNNIQNTLIDSLDYVTLGDYKTIKDK